MADADFEDVREFARTAVGLTDIEGDVKRFQSAHTMHMFPSDNFNVKFTGGIDYRVADCAVALDAVKRNGHKVIDEAPRPGSRGTTVAFIHPKTAYGTLIELVQE